MTPRLEALDAFIGALKVEPKLPFHQWAEGNICNPDGSPFRFRPYQVLPAADMFETRVASIALRQYSGAGKTFLFSVGYAYAVAQLKLSIGKMFPAENLSTEWLRDKLMPILHESLSLPMAVDNALFKQWENGATIKGVGANSGGRIRTLEIDVADADEIDAIEQTQTDEGDKLAIFLRRTRGRRRQHHWLASYPSIKGSSKIDSRIDISDGCRWFYDCPRCGDAQYFDTPNVVYPDGRPAKAVMECPGCSSTFSDKDRRASVEQTGHWRNRDGERVEPGDIPSEDYGRRRGLHLNCTAHVGSHADKFSDYLHEIASGVESWKSAENPEKSRRVFDNTMRAQSFEPTYAETASAGDLEDSRAHVEDDTLPDDVVAIYAGVDPNKEFLAVQVIGWGEHTVYPLLYAELKGNWERSSTWAPLTKLMKRKWKHPSGAEIGIRMSCWDSRFQSDAVYGYARKHGRRVICTRGSPAKGAPPISTIQKKPKERVRVMTVGSSELKAMVYDWISPAIPTKTNVVFTDLADADGFDYFGPEYFEGLTAEDRTEEPHAGRLIPVFKHDGRVRNEPLDTFGYCIAASKVDRFDYAKRKKEVEALAAQIEETPAPARRKRPRYSGAKSGGWI
jgi:phage terminase large subunit GpA-like protein